MKSIQLQSKVGTDGVLNLKVPIGREDAGHQVVVTIEPAQVSDDKQAMDTVSWRDFLKETFGSCAGLGLKR